MSLLLVLLLTSFNFNLNHGVTNIISSSCTTTFYPELCYSTLSISEHKLATKKDVIEHTINKTKEIVEANLHTLTTLTTATNLTKRATMALHECLDMESTTLEHLNTAIHYLREYPTKKPLHQYANDLKTLMSTTITNKETCLDALLYNNDATAKWLHESIVEGEEHGGKMCSNVLAMIKNMTDTYIANIPAEQGPRGGGKRKYDIMWPEWLSKGDRRRLGLGGLFLIPNAVVSKDGKGNYTTIGAAVEAAPTKSKKRYVIKITAGTYKEYVQVPKTKNNIMFVGEGRGKTIITGNKNVAAKDGTNTTGTATVSVMGERFLARDITFQNTAGPKGEQAVALRVASDLSAFYKCGMEGYQDTLYVHSGRQFFVKCFITGTVDFIFGNAAVVFQFCDIMARKPGPNQRNMITAQGRTDKNQETGIVIHKCNIGATSDLKPVQGNIPTYLGRPWKEFSRTVVMHSLISDVVHKEGWHPWDGDFALNTLYFREYQNIGSGADTSKRVKWKTWGVIKDGNEARNFTVSKFINGWTWLLSTGFPFWPGI